RVEPDEANVGFRQEVEEQLARLVARGNISAAEAQQRVDAQLPADLKKRLAHYVIDTSGTKEDTSRQTLEVYHSLRSVQKV
ncbi:MAG: dephospho-CoA kinase, partial [Acidobacteriota bacterium]